jgi:HEAT repeat protein
MESRTELVRLVADPAAFFAAVDPDLRRMAVSAAAGRIAEFGVLDGLGGLLADDPDEAVRAEAAEVLGGAGPAAMAPLRKASADPSPRVREAVATACGETGDPATVPWLMDNAAHADDAQLREAAVAALGAIGDARAVPLLIRLAGEAPPQVRRRVIVALTAFDGDDVEAAVRAALDDRNPMVREAAEMVAGRPIDPALECGPIANVLADLELAPAKSTEQSE